MAQTKKVTKRDLARNYRAKHGVEMPTHKLARIMYRENNLTFINVEDARTALRAIEGKQGTNEIPKDKSLILNVPSRPLNPYKLPKSDEERYKPFTIKGYKRGLIINDIHLPYHSIQALNAVLEYGVSYKPDFIFINGDLVDFHQLSYFQKDPMKKRFSKELKIMQEFLENLYTIFNCKIFYKFGNHEERYDSFLYQKAGELVGVDEFKLETLVKNRVPDIDIIRDKRLVVAGGLPFIHGHEFGRGVFNPVNAARGLYLQAKHSAVKGDCHTSSEHSEPNIFGKIMTTYSVGCLCGLTPKWLPLNKWNHGFATIDIIAEKEFRFRNYRIYNGKIL